MSVTLSAPQKAFAETIGHDFASPALLQEALTHPSMASPGRADNQRLEFLGDRVLGLVMAEALMRADAAAAEGDLAPRLNTLVRKETLADVARQTGLGEALRLGRSEMLTGGRKRDAALADAMEAVIAAVYLDAGLDAVRDMVLTLWGDRVKKAEKRARDAKTALQEWAQARGRPPPVYEEVARDGPPHAPVFTVRAQLADGAAATAQATSKRQAEQRAAEALLKQMGGSRS